MIYTITISTIFRYIFDNFQNYFYLFQFAYSENFILLKTINPKMSLLLPQIKSSDITNNYIYQQSEDMSHIMENISTYPFHYQIFFSNITDTEYDNTNTEFTLFQPQVPSLFHIANQSTKNTKIRSRENRKDYLLKEFKCRCGKYIISLLNSVTPHRKFCLFDYKTFTQNISYEDNAKWLRYTVKELLCEFDKKNNRNSKLVKKAFKKRNANEKLIQLLNKTYEEVIIDYSNEQLCKDILMYDIDNAECYKRLGGNKEGSFIYIVKNTKGNKKKK